MDPAALRSGLLAESEFLPSASDPFTEGGSRGINNRSIRSGRWHASNPIDLMRKVPECFVRMRIAPMRIVPMLIASR